MAVVATGFFDGVHKGHQEVINTLVSLARSRGEEAIVISFASHPRTVLQQDARHLRLLNSLEEKMMRLQSLGVNRVEILSFSKDFAALTAKEYIQSILIERYGATCLVMGYDNRLGSDKLTPEAISSIVKPLKIELVVVSSLRAKRGNLANSEIASSPISSTIIRRAISEGQVEKAAQMLGYEYSLKGVVVGGKQIGRTIGYPTANMQMYNPLKIIPGRGVYLSSVKVLNKEYYGMTNVGDIVETHIFNFNEDIYGLDIEVIFKERIRDSKKFASLNELKSQLAEDHNYCNQIVSSLRGLCHCEP